MQISQGYVSGQAVQRWEADWGCVPMVRPSKYCSPACCCGDAVSQWWGLGGTGHDPHSCDNHRGDRRDSSVAADCEWQKHVQALHTPRVHGGEQPSGHAAQGREEESPCQMCADRAAHQGLAGGTRVGVEGGYGQASLPASVEEPQWGSRGTKDV